MSGYRIRAATGDDEASILDTLRRAHRIVIHTEVDRGNSAAVLDLIRRCRVFLVTEGDHLAGICAFAIAPPTIAQVRVSAVRDRWREHDVLRALLPVAASALEESGVETLAYVGSESWLLSCLAAVGFAHTDTVVALQKDDFCVPDRGDSRTVGVRPAEERDLDAILAIDEAAFEPLWRNTRETLRECLDRLPYVCVAEVDGVVVGYLCLSLIGRHGHITRIAVHPRFQGHRIAVRLLVQGIAFYQQRDAFAITLNTQLDNERAQRLYAWFGFRLLGQEAQVMRYHLHP